VYLRDYFLKTRCDAFDIFKVERETRRFAGVFDGDFSRGFGKSFYIASQQANICTIQRQPLGYRQTDASAAARYQGRFAI
jgi:hypothetical protein